MGIFAFIVTVIASIIDRFYGMGAVRRRRAMSAAARRLGLQYLPGDPYNLPRLHGHMPAFGVGRSRRAYNMLRGNAGGHLLLLTDYKYFFGTQSIRRTFYRTYCLLYSDKVFGDLYVRPEGFLEKVAEAAGFDDIDFESKEFNDMFYVRSNNKRFAYDIINPRMMDYLAGCPGLHLEFSGDVMLAHYNRRLKPRQIEPLVRVVKGIAGIIPTYL